MKHLKYLLMAALVAMPLTACDEDDGPIIEPTPTGTITGTVSAEGAGLSGVSVTMVGATTLSATTGANGAYTFTNVEAGSYGIAIDASNHPAVSFSVTSKTTSITSQGQTSTVDFSGSYIRTAALLGSVTASGAPLAGVSVSVTGGPDNVTNNSVTNAGGEYSATGLRAGTYSVTISNLPTGVTFTATTQSVTLATGESKTAHFPGQAVQLATISGAVTVDNVGTAGVAVALSGGATAATETGPGGAFSFTGLTPGAYTVTITPPTNTDFAVVAKNIDVAAGQTGVVNFAGKGPEVPATISIQSVTKGGTTIPVDQTNVFGQIEVALNIVKGSRAIQLVEVWIGDKVVAAQTFTPPPVADEAELADAEVIILSVPTNQVRWGGDAYVPVVFNGQNIIAAKLYEVGETPAIPSNNVPVVMNNKDVLLVGDVVIEPITLEPNVTTVVGTWYKSDVRFSGPQYVAFSTEKPTSVNWPSVGGVCPVSGTVDGEVGTGLVITNTYDCDDRQGYVVPNSNVVPTFDPALPPAGPQGSTVQYPDSGFVNLGAEFELMGEDRWFLIAKPFLVDPALLDGVYADKKAPTVEVFGQSPSTLLVGADPLSALKVAFNRFFDEPWVNADYAFLNAMRADDGNDGVGVDADTRTTWKWAGGTAACAASTEIIVTGDDLDETLVSDGSPDGYKLCATASDLLGNTGVSLTSNWFGVDKVAPLIRAYDDTAGSGEYSPVLADIHMAIFSQESKDLSYDADWVWAFEAQDARSGFHQGVVIEDLPAMQSLTHFPGLGTAPIACDQFDSQLYLIGAGVQWVRSNVVDFTCLADLVEPGYFWYDNKVTDRAGNTATLGTALYAVDDLASPGGVGAGPTFDAMQFLTTFYNPGEPAGFSIFGSDDLEVIEAEIALVHPVNVALNAAGELTINYGWNAIDAFQRFDGIDPFDASLFSSVVIGETVETGLPVFGRFDYVCTAGAAPYGSCVEEFGVAPDSTEYNLVLDNDFSMLPTEATGRIQDVGFNVADLLAPITFIPAQWQTATAAPWSRIAAGTVSDLIIRRFYIEEVTANVAFKAVMEAPTSIEVPWFDAVALVNNVAGDITICGFFTYTGTNDTGFDRFFNYAATVPTGSVCDGAVGTWHAVGLKGAAALVSIGLP